MRQTLDAILMNAARDLRTQADAVERALQDRVSTTDEIREKLETDLKDVGLLKLIRLLTNEIIRSVNNETLSLSDSTSSG